MRNSLLWTILISQLSTLPAAQAPSAERTIPAPGLQARVEVHQDPWGISHIFAETESDLFFAQGYIAARDRLFQLELWRRSATGTVSEILGEKTVQQDIGARLLAFRGDLDTELNHYHPQGAAIIRSFVRGINAYVDSVNEHPTLLPVEFRLLGIKPGRWTEEVVISRHNGLFRNASFEVEAGRLAASLGAERLSELLDLEPGPKKLEIPKGIDFSVLNDFILETYQASRKPFSPGPEDIVDPEWRAAAAPEQALQRPRNGWKELASLGSNNWAVRGSRTITGDPFLANDPHRSLQVPSLRYFVHLAAPGWNVIGGGEPALPGVSIGHNEHGAWGLTIFAIDQEDLYVYETDPENPLRYRYKGGWEEMTEIPEIISIEGGRQIEVRLKFTRHGPVIHEDPAGARAYALRAAWLETGTSPYLASLRFDQARSWPEFRRACEFFLAPSENMVWADREGNIGWQATGISPVRPNWDGLLPVPGDGSYEWDGFLPARDLPSSSNPPEGYVATANQENLPPGYPRPVGFLWAEPFRHARLVESLASPRLLSLADMVSLQQDYLSIPARWLIPLLSKTRDKEARALEATKLLEEWDHVLDPGSPAAAIYMNWERQLVSRAWDLRLPEELRDRFSRKSLKKTIEWLQTPGPEFGADPVEGRDRLLLESLQAALEDLEKRFGPDRNSWKWGGPDLHHTTIRHTLSGAVRESRREKLDIGPVPRGGSASTVNMTNNTDNQTSGASFRVVFDLEDWDRSLATNMPGQSGDPDSTHYRDLVDSWAAGQYFPLLYSKEKIKAASELKTVLVPARKEEPGDR